MCCHSPPKNYPPAARSALVERADAAKGWERIQSTKACLVLAERLAETGGAAEARAIYAHLRRTRSNGSEAYIREAAERGLAALG